MNVGLDELLQAALLAPPDRREAALRLLEGRAPAPEPLLTLRELSRRTGFGVSTLRRWQVPACDLGGRRRYRLSEVQEYFKSNVFQRRVAALRAERKGTGKGEVVHA